MSTHAVEREFDFVHSSRRPLLEDIFAGADMMWTIEFNSVCYYRYAVVDWGKAGGESPGRDAVLASKG
ncbi:MAG: type I-E CRISPR-associated protein Cas7/Cse4/CasC [Proteobacteria bacterium]|nr:type I-E CRISPR-associated protein Cas7/Cse4/CasC [Pseudomonadota bacterium]